MDAYTYVHTYIQLRYVAQLLRNQFNFIFRSKFKVFVYCICMYIFAIPEHRYFLFKSYQVTLEVVEKSIRYLRSLSHLSYDYKYV